MSDRELPRELKADDFTISLGVHRFDPADAPTRPRRRRSTAKPLDVAAGGEAADVPVGPDPADTRIVQFAQTLGGEDIARMREQYGLALTAYVPNFAYVERVDDATRRRLRRDPLVRAVIAYLPAYKLSDRIGDPTLPTPEGIDPGQFMLDATLFDGGSAERVVEVLREIGAHDIRVRDERPMGGFPRITFVLDDVAVVDEIAKLDDVRWIEPVSFAKFDAVKASAVIQSGDDGKASIWDKGIHGEGQIIGMIDSTPLDINHCFFADAAPNTFGPAHRKVRDIRDVGGTTVPTGHGTFVAGCAAGDQLGSSGTHSGRGSAWAARLVSGTKTDVDVRGLLAELTDAMNAGAFVHTNSWHDRDALQAPAPYNNNARDVDNFTWTNEDHVVLGSAGNAGEEQGSPGTAKNAICVAAAASGDNPTTVDDGNPGPTADGRRKPDLVAVGCGIESAQVGTACTTQVSPNCATSWATPHAAGAAALVRQYFVEGWSVEGEKVATDAVTPSGSLIKAVLINSTVNMSGEAGYPNQDEGWGLIRLERTLSFAGGRREMSAWDVPHLVGLATRETGKHEINVLDDAEQLKITLVWADPPPAVGAFATPTVNDLDLRVTSPDGTRYVGNDFTNGVSTPNSVNIGDAINTVEMVVVDNPVEGDWIIEVIAARVAVGNPGQGYAVVATATTKAKRCFVASTVYGDPDHRDVEALRAWRDRHLEPGSRGRTAMRTFAATYARIGPLAARVVERQPALRRVLRERLFPPLARAARGEGLRWG